MIRYIVLLLVIPLSLSCRLKNFEYIKDAYTPPYIPWFTGTPLPPSAVGAVPGKPIGAAILFLTLTHGQYQDNWKLKEIDNIWSVMPFFEFLVGFNNYIGIDIYPSFISNFQNGKSSTHLKDFYARIGFQIARDIPKTWVPDIRILIQTDFPTGNYQKLNPRKMGIDATGEGSFQTGFNLAVQKLFPLENNFLLLKWSSVYLFPSSVHVKGFNAYGGGFGTSGKVFPGQTLMFFFSGQYSINQNWCFAFDTLLEYQGKSSFSGNRGRTPQGTKNFVGRPPSIQYSISPQIEYNFSGTSGMLIGLWTTVFGRNCPAFASLIGGYYSVF